MTKSLTNLLFTLSRKVQDKASQQANKLVCETGLALYLAKDRMTSVSRAPPALAKVFIFGRDSKSCCKLED